MPQQTPTEDDSERYLKRLREYERMRFDERLEHESIHPIDYALEEDERRREHPDEVPVLETRMIESQIIATIREKEKLGIDPLTGAINKSRYPMEMQKLQAQARRNRHPEKRRTDPRVEIKEPFSIIYFDIDHFREINNTYGHKAGDMVLEELGQRILNRVRIQSGDLFARIGGEEFCVVILAANGNAPDVAEELRKLIGEIPFNIIDDAGEKKSIKATMSLGVSPYDNDTAIMERQADSALYKAKGKDRVGKQRDQVWVWDKSKKQPVYYEPDSRNASEALAA